MRAKFKLCEEEEHIQAREDARTVFRVIHRPGIEPGQGSSAQALIEDLKWIRALIEKDGADHGN